MSNPEFMTAFDAFKAQLEAYSESEPSADQFAVKADVLRDIPNGGGAMVLMYLGVMSPGECTKGHAEYKTPYIFDLLAFGKGKKKAGTYTEADAVASERVRLLIHQVLNALFDPEHFDLVMGCEWPRIEPLFLGEQKTERALAGARITLEKTTVWEPVIKDGEPLTEINVTADKWAALFKPQEV